MSGPLRIAVIGAECTGKTTLCRALAQARGGLWVPEYLREFVDSQDRPPLAEEQGAIMAEQIARESRALAQAASAGQPLAAADSAPLATALYSRMYFDDDSLLAAATAHQRHYDLTVVTDIDLPWEPDGLQRDGPQMRARFHELLLDWLRAHAIGFTQVSGTEDARLAVALQAVDSLRARTWQLRAAR